MNKKKYATALALLGTLSAPVSGAAMPLDKKLASLGNDTSMRNAIIRVQAAEPVLAPMAHVLFCSRHQSQCKSGAAALLQNDDRTFNALLEINRQVNAAIEPMQQVGVVGNWKIGPSAGDCNDYAVTKRDRLIKRGFPASALLLAHVVTSWGEHHLVLVARTANADFVLDNLRSDIRRVEKSGYRWVRIQSSTQAEMWNTARVKRDAAPAAPVEIEQRSKPVEPMVAAREPLILAAVAADSDATIIESEVAAISADVETDETGSVLADQSRVDLFY